MGFSSALSIEPWTVLWKEMEGMSVFGMCSYKIQCLSSICARHSTYMDSHKNLAGSAACKLRSKPLTYHIVELRSGEMLQSCFCKSTCFLFSCVFLCVLKGTVVIICTVFSRAHLFKKRFCIIFICPPSCLMSILFHR